MCTDRLLLPPLLDLKSILTTSKVPAPVTRLNYSQQWTDTMSETLTRSWVVCTELGYIWNLRLVLLYCYMLYCYMLNLPSTKLLNLQITGRDLIWTSRTNNLMHWKFSATFNLSWFLWSLCILPPWHVKTLTACWRVGARDSESTRVPVHTYRFLLSHSLHSHVHW